MKIFSSLLIVFILWTNIWFANQDIYFKSYKDNIDLICDDYKTKKVFIKKETKYKEIKKLFWLWESSDSVIKWTNELYSDTMNSIYRCAIINTQIVALKNFKKNLVNKYDKTWDIKKKLLQKIDDQINKLKEKRKFKAIKIPLEALPNWWYAYEEKEMCTTEKVKETYHKQNVLDNLTYETCKYFYYLDYLKEYYTDINNLWLFVENKDMLWTDNLNNTFKPDEEDINKLQNKWVNINTPWDEQERIFKKINNTRTHAKEVFTMTFVAYMEYENNYPIHLLLQIIREDFIVFRKKLHEVLNPINQVVYKIVNCQNL